MAKKRKQRSSDPVSSGVSDPQPQEPIQDEEQEELEQTAVEQEREVEVQEEVKVEEEVEVDEEEEVEEEDDKNQEPREGELKENETLGASEDGGPASNGGEKGQEEDLGDEPVEKLLEPFGKDQLIGLIKKAVDEHPEFFQSVREIADADPAHRKIFVHGLSWDTTAETLTNEFVKYGVIEECKVVTDRVTGKSKGYAFIQFKHRSG